MPKKKLTDLSPEEFASSLKNTINQEGFFLEEKAATILNETLKEIKHIETNVSFDEDKNTDTPRRSLDVLAIGQTTEEKHSKKFIACEVKGGSADTKLILIQKKIEENQEVEPKKVIEYKFYFDSMSQEGGIQQAKNGIVTPILKDISPVFCYTGDFYKWHDNNESFKKANTSLYKATEQLFHGIEGFLSNQYIEHWEDDLYSSSIIPIIVTNVDIYVARHESLTEITKVQSAILENSIRFRHANIDFDPQIGFIDKVFPYCWIVHIDSLSDLIKAPFGLSERGQLKWI